jgi:FSR family fosmidomycin resistance protein-like MFS transporter
MPDPGSVGARDPGGEVRHPPAGTDGAPAARRDAGVAPAAAAGAVPRLAVRPNARVLALLALGHLVIDMNQGALPSLLPFLKSKFALSYAAAGTILLVANVTSSLIQPLFGYLADRTARRWLLPVSLVLASAGVGLAGWAPSYGALLALVLVGGLGIAAFHPEGYKTAHQVAGDRKATGLAFFSIGGNIGIAVGPPVVTLLVTAFTLRGTLGMLGPGLLTAALTAAVLPTLVPPAATGTAARQVRGGRDMLGAMALLVGIVTVRSWAQLGLVAYVPFLYVDVFGADPRVVGPLLFVFLGAGAVGTLVGGPIADRWGARRYVTYSILAAAPLIVAFLLRQGDWIATALLAATGFALVSSFSVTVALAQAYLPRRLGTAAGLVVGFAIGTGGVGVTLLGWIADHWGLLTALGLVAGLPVVGFGLALFLPEPRP